MYRIKDFPMKIFTWLKLLLPMLQPMLQLMLQPMLQLMLQPMLQPKLVFNWSLIELDLNVGPENELS